MISAPFRCVAPRSIALPTTPPRIAPATLPTKASGEPPWPIVEPATPPATAPAVAPRPLWLPSIVTGRIESTVAS
jgi:hypothetical protein